MDFKGLRETLEEIPEGYRGIATIHLASVYSMGYVAATRVAFMFGRQLPNEITGINEARTLFSKYGVDIDIMIRKEGEEMKTDFRV